jgi:manganese peroxidase
MALKNFASLLVLAVAAVNAASIQRRVTCPDGNSVTNSACCDFFALRDDLQANLYVSERCGYLSY